MVHGFWPSRISVSQNTKESQKTPPKTKGQAEEKRIGNRELRELRELGVENGEKKKIDCIRKGRWRSMEIPSAQHFADRGWHRLTRAASEPVGPRKGRATAGFGKKLESCTSQFLSVCLSQKGGRKKVDVHRVSELHPRFDQLGDPLGCCDLEPRSRHVPTSAVTVSMFCLEIFCAMP